MMEGINAYSRPTPDGKGVTVDVERMTVDLITVLKAGGYTKSAALGFVGKIFDDVTVKVRIPGSAKN
jgi:hypothetical protein